MINALKEQFEDCKKFLAKAQLNEAFEGLLEIVRKDGFQENQRIEVAKLKTRFASLNAKNRNGLIKTEDLITEENKIGSALFELVQELEEFFLRKIISDPALISIGSETKYLQDSPNGIFYKHLTKGEKLLEIKHYQESVEEYKKAHELFPEDEFVLKQLIIANIEGYLAKFDTVFKEQAKVYGQKAFDMNPSNQDFVDLYKIAFDLKSISKYRDVFGISIMNALYASVALIVFGLLGIGLQFSMISNYDPFEDGTGIVILSISLFLIAFYLIMSGLSETKRDTAQKKLHNISKNNLIK